MNGGELFLKVVMPYFIEYVRQSKTILVFNGKYEVIFAASLTNQKDIEKVVEKIDNNDKYYLYNNINEIFSDRRKSQERMLYKHNLIWLRDILSRSVMIERPEHLTRYNVSLNLKKEESESYAWNVLVNLEKCLELSDNEVSILNLLLNNKEE